MYDLQCKLDISKAAGPDEVSARLSKEGALCLTKPLATLFTLSLSQGCLPSDWTSANISPVIKKGNKHLVTNYRPISLTSTVVKLLERLVHCQLTHFLERKNKLSPLQHGFRKVLPLNYVRSHSEYCRDQSYAHYYLSSISMTLGRTYPPIMASLPTTVQSPKK